MKSRFFLKKFIHTSAAIFINKPVGAIRDVFRARYLGVSFLSDAFLMAWKMPNMLRRILTDGSFSAALIPTLIEVEEKEGKEEVNRVISLLLFFMGMLTTLICLYISYKAEFFIFLFSPGAVDRILYTKPLLKILIFFTLFMALSSIISTALQIKNNFFVGPLSQLFLNIFLIGEYWAGEHYFFSLKTLSYCFIVNGIFVLFLHLAYFYRFGFKFVFPQKKTFFFICNFFKKVIPVMITSSISEINIIVDQGIASYLPVGAQTLIEYSATFIRIPLQVFGSALITVITPTLSKVAIKNPKRISFYINEIIKTSFFIALPSIILIYFFAEKTFSLLYVSNNFSVENAIIGAKLLMMFSWFLFFAIANRFLLVIFYGRNLFTLTTIVSLFCSVINIGLNIFFIFFIKKNVFFIILSTVISEALRTVILFNVLIFKKYFFLFPLKILKELIQISSHILLSLLSFFIFYYSSYFLLITTAYYNLLFNSLAFFILNTIFLLFSLLFFYKTKKMFSYNLYFLKI